MARLAYHVTAGTADAGHIKVAPKAWYSVGAVQSIFLKQAVNKGGPLLVNIAEEKITAVSLGFVDDSALETDGRPLFVFGAEGQRFVSDDGVA